MVSERKQDAGEEHQQAQLGHPLARQRKRAGQHHVFLDAPAQLEGNERERVRHRPQHQRGQVERARTIEAVGHVAIQGRRTSRAQRLAPGCERRDAVQQVALLAGHQPAGTCRLPVPLIHPVPPCAAPSERTRRRMRERTMITDRRTDASRIRSLTEGWRRWPSPACLHRDIDGRHACLHHRGMSIRIPIRLPPGIRPSRDN